MANILTSNKHNTKIQIPGIHNNCNLYYRDGYGMDLFPKT
jgi:hypothetical protein